MRAHTHVLNALRADQLDLRSLLADGLEMRRIAIGTAVLVLAAGIGAGTVVPRSHAETGGSYSASVAAAGPSSAEASALQRASHHVEQSVFPNWNGSTQTRFFDLTRKGKVLT